MQIENPHNTNQAEIKNEGNSTIKENLKNLLEMTDRQLEDIKPELRDFIQYIVDEQPDVIIFLDKGARIFGTPIKKYLRTLNLQKIPEIRYFNDHDLKGIYLNVPGATNQNTNLSGYAESEFGNIKNKKVFFFDETFSSGKGAAAIKQLKEQLGNDDIFYFALTRDLNCSDNIISRAREFANYGISLEDHEQTLTKIKSDDKFIIYDNRMPDLFSKKASVLYLDEVEDEGKTITVHSESEKLSKIIKKENERLGRRIVKIPNAYDFTGEDSKEIMKDNYRTITAIKDKIYKALVNE